MRASLPVLAALLLVSCGYPGDPLPPALNRPSRVTDLAVLERGSNLFVVFTMPEKTTEGLPIATPPDIELRVGAVGDRFVESEWVSGSHRVPPDALHQENGRVEARIPAEKFYGRTVVIAVRLHGPKGREVGWSNLELVNVLPALPKPEGLSATDVSGGVGLAWRVATPAVEFRIFRRPKADKEWAFLGLSSQANYTDSTVEYGREYEYFVQSGQKSAEKYAESELSDTLAFKPVDRFAPAPPTGLVAIPGTKTIELVWNRSPEADWALYRVYRGNVLLADAIQAASFGDKDVVPGAKHTYQVTSVDTAGNESTRSVAVDATLP